MTARHLAASFERARGLLLRHDLHAAEDLSRGVLVEDPTNHDALNVLGLVAYERREYRRAAQLFEAAIEHDAVGRLWGNLGRARLELGDPIGANAAFRRAVVADPSAVSAWTGLMFAGDMLAGLSPAQKLADRRAFDHWHTAALTAQAPPSALDRDPSRRLRVGYLGADFRDHSAARVIEPVLEGHALTGGVMTAIYSHNLGPPDRITERFLEYAGIWRDVEDLDDETLARTIRDDRIDILVDLMGYTTSARLGVLARKPAPLVMSGWGYLTALGLDCADYVLADAVMIPEGEEGLYHEKILRLPCALPFSRYQPVAEVTPPPKGRLYPGPTYGYFGRPQKCSDTVWATWAAILTAAPGSRLILKAEAYEDDGYRECVGDHFLARGLGPDRVQFRGATSKRQHLAEHGEVDVMLDPWPMGGAVSLLESLWMGVPVATLAGTDLASRAGDSILTYLGFGDWVAPTIAEYVDLAVRAGQHDWTAEDRLALRGDLQRSILMDPKRYAEAVEEQYRLAWRRWCEEKTHG